MPRSKFAPGEWHPGGVSHRFLSKSSISGPTTSQVTQTATQESQASTHNTNDVNTSDSEWHVDTEGSIFGSSPRQGREGSQSTKK